MTDLTEKVLAGLDEDIAKLKDYIRHLKELISHDSHKSEPDWALVQYLDIAETSLAYLVALRRQVEKHEEDGFGWCNSCIISMDVMTGRYVYESSPCTFIKEVATDLGISE